MQFPQVFENPIEELLNKGRMLVHTNFDNLLTCQTRPSSSLPHLWSIDVFASFELGMIALIMALLLPWGIQWGQSDPAERLRLRRVEAKLDLILAQLGVQYHGPDSPAGLSDEVRQLANDPSQKIQAIKLHREQTGASLLEAKQAVEAYIAGQR